MSAERRPGGAPSESSAKKTGSTIATVSDTGGHAGLAGPSRAVGPKRRAALRQLAFTDEQQAGLAAARRLVAWGVPVFLAKPARDPDGRWLPEGGHSGTGYRFPRGWQHTTPDLTVVDRWRPGMALCAVMGHVLDLLDVDPRNGGDTSRETLTAEGIWPAVHCQAATPSGGHYDFVSSMGVSSRNGVLPGLDVKAGSAGRGHGFAFIAPTVRSSKTTGGLVAYRWVRPPSGPRPSSDTSGRALVERLSSAPTGVRATACPAPADSHVAGWGREQLALLSPREMPCAAMQERLDRAGKQLANGGRHNAILGNVVQLVRLAKEGHLGLPQALDALRRDFVTRVRDDRGGAAAADAEWQRSLDGALTEVLRGTCVLPRYPACDCFLRRLREAAARASPFSKGQAGLTEESFLNAVRATHPTAYFPWTPEEEAKLIEMA